MAEDKQEEPTTTGNKEDGELSPDQGVETKHPLEHRWTLWFDAGNSSKSNPGNWGTTLRSVYTFDSVEDFWW